MAWKPTAERRRTTSAASGQTDASGSRGIFARSSMGIALIDPAGRFIDNNPVFQRMLGYAGDELRGKTFYDITNPEDQEAVGAALSKILTGPLHDTQIEARLVPRADGTLWTRLTISLLRHGEAGPIGAVVALEDISVRKSAEDALRFSEFRFRALFESNIAPLYFWDADGRVLDANDAFLSLIKYNRQELQAGRLRWDVLVAPEYREREKQARDELSSGRHPFVMYEKEYLLRDGRRVPVMVSLSLLPAYPDRGFGCTIDLTQQKLALKRSEESQDLIQAVFASLSGYIAVLDRAGTILAVNEAWVGLVREKDANPPAAGVGVNYLDVCQRAVRSGDRSAHRALAGIQAVLRGKRQRFVMDYPCGPRWFEMIVEPLRRADGGAIVSHIDITDRRQAEIEARKMRLELSHFARVAMMGELTGSLAHELSQPLTAISANAHSARRLLNAPTPDLAEIGEIIDDIVVDNRRASDTIRHVRSLLNKAPPEYQLLDINSVVADVISFINTEALAKNVAVALHLAHDLPETRGDRIQLQQVVLNLLLNAFDAMKDTPASERFLDVTTARIDKDTLEVSIQDTGTGIPPDMRDKLFRPFFTAKSNGLGLGLPICRSIIEAHGGRIWATSLKCGAIFRFTLPITARSTA